MDKADMGTPGNGGDRWQDGGHKPEEWPEGQEWPDGQDGQSEPEGEEVLQRQLASYAFVREDDDREVRLLFRDVPANEIALSFRRAGATLITITGERALAPFAAGDVPPTPDQTDPLHTSLPATPDDHRRSTRGIRHGQPDTESHLHRRTGELTMRYFFFLNEIVYTVSIIFLAGIADSIANIYPAATLSEHELQARLGVVFR